jgi:hypothetical protein
MNPDKIFGLFNEETNQDKELENFKESNYFKLSMFLKVLKNKDNIDNILSTLTNEDLGNVGEHITFYRAYYWFEQIDIESICKSDITLLDFTNIEFAIDYTIKFYESLEEYEKCAELKKFKDTILSL